MNSQGWSEAQEVVWRMVLLDVLEKVLNLDSRQLLAMDLKIGYALAKMMKDLIPRVQKRLRRPEIDCVKWEPGSLRSGNSHTPGKSRLCTSGIISNCLI